MGSATSQNLTLEPHLWWRPARMPAGRRWGRSTPSARSTCARRPPRPRGPRPQRGPGAWEEKACFSPCFPTFFVLLLFLLFLLFLLLFLFLLLLLLLLFPLLLLSLHAIFFFFLARLSSSFLPPGCALPLQLPHGPSLVPQGVQKVPPDPLDS